MATSNALLDSLGLVQAATETSNATNQTGSGEAGAAILLIILLGCFALFSHLAGKQDRNRRKLDNKDKVR